MGHLREGVLSVTGREERGSGSEALDADPAKVDAAIKSLDDRWLTAAEKTAVVVALHRQMADMEGSTQVVVVQATAVVKGSGTARSQLVVVEAAFPATVVAGVTELARWGSSELWAQIRAALAVARGEADD